MIKIYNIVWRNISDNLIVWFWRNIKYFNNLAIDETWLKEYIFCVVTPLQKITNDLFELAFNAKNYLIYNGQVTILEFTLNDYFDSAPRRIKITDVNALYFELYLQGEPITEPFTVYLQGEIDPAPFDIYLGGDVTGDFDFFVETPTGLAFDQSRMEQIINTYRTAGKRYSIITV